MTTPIIYIILIALVVVIILTLICREIVCWYFKINNIVKILQKIDKELENIKYRLKNN